MSKIIDESSMLTLFRDIPEVGGAARPKTALVFTTGVKRESPYNLLVFLHGHEMAALENWLLKDVRFAIREKVDESRKNIVLVVPGLGPSSEAGKLSTNPDWYIDRVLEEIGMIDNGPPARLGKLVLSAHSGGGSRMWEAATLLSKYATNLVECWGFDCLYGEGKATPYSTPKTGVPPAKTHPLSKAIEYKWATSSFALRIHYLTGGSTAIRSENLATLIKEDPSCRALVFPTKQAHPLIPREHIRERLDALTL